MNKKWIRHTLVLMFVFSSIIILFNYIIDPFHIYRSSQEKKLYWGEQRWQLAGLAKNYDYNTIILGTSMTENFVPSEVNNVLSGAKTLKLSLSGSSSHEQNKIAQLAFGHQQIKNVIWGIDYTSLSKDDNVNEEFPLFLYDRNMLNDVNYLLNVTTVKYSVNSLLYRVSPKASQVSSAIINLSDSPIQDLNSLSYWGDLFQYDQEIVIKDYMKKIKRDELKENKEELRKNFNFIKFKNNLDKNIIPYVKNYPETQFYFYYPPYSILMNKRFYNADPAIVTDIIKSREYFYSQIKNCPNVKLYDFTTEKEITFNLNLYKDTMHHNAEVNKYILSSFTEDKYLITENNIDSVLHEFKTQIVGFNMAYLD